MTRLFTILILLSGFITTNAQTFLHVDVHQADSIIKANVINPIFTILDVRTLEEYEEDHLENAQMRDFYADDFRDQLDALSKERIYLIYCRSGNRSGRAFDMMKELEFTEVYNMLGGITTWKNSDYPVTKEVPEEQDLTTSTKQVTIQSLSVSPNPVKDHYLRLNNLSAKGAIKLYTAMGQMLSTEQVQAPEIFVGHLPKGIYFLQFVSTENNEIFIGRFLKL